MDMALHGRVDNHHHYSPQHQQQQQQQQQDNPTRSPSTHAPRAQARAHREEYKPRTPERSIVDSDRTGRSFKRDNKTNNPWITDHPGLSRHNAFRNRDELDDLDEPLDDSDSIRLVINVGGHKHETSVETLLNHPMTRLGRLGRRHTLLLSRDSTYKRQYYFDRNPSAFHSIIDYYRTGQLHYPTDVCGALFRRELNYWGIDEGYFDTCCLSAFSSFTNSEVALERLRSKLEIDPSSHSLRDVLSGHYPSNESASIREKLWLILNSPRSSFAALLYSVISFGVIILSLVEFTMETLPQFEHEENITCSLNPPVFMMKESREHWLSIVDLSCSGFILLELTVKFFCCPDKKRFLRYPLTIMDFLSMIPSLLTVILHGTAEMCMPENLHHALHLLFVFRVVRVFRIFHYMRHYGPFRILLCSLKATANALVMLVVFMSVSVIFFGTCVYYAEKASPDYAQVHDRDEFTDLTRSFWWAIVTLSTVGYGDVTPKTSFGYAVASVVALAGLVMLAFVVPIISTEFSQFYNFDIALKNIHKHCKYRTRRQTLTNASAREAFRRLRCKTVKLRNFIAAPPADDSVELTTHDREFNRQLDGYQSVSTAGSPYRGLNGDLKHCADTEDGIQEIIDDNKVNCLLRPEKVRFSTRSERVVRPGLEETSLTRSASMSRAEDRIRTEDHSDLQLTETIWI